MIKINLDDLHKIKNLFKLLSLPGDDLELEQEYNNLQENHEKKEAALAIKDFEKAAEFRQQELNMIKGLITLLNTKGILKGNLLEISVC